MVRLAIVVLNYRTPALTIQCLTSLEGEVSADDRVIVVENGSGDDSADVLAQTIAQHGWEKWVTLIIAPKNGGFSAGNNIGIQAVNASAYLLLNSDTLVRPGALETLYAGLQSHPQAGIVSPRLEWPDGTPQISCFRYISPVSEFLTAAKTGPLDKLFGRFVVPIPISEAEIRPNWTSFAAVLIRAATIKEVGLMDEGYFLYFEDVDYGRRVWQSGWEIVHIPSAHIIHLRGGSSDVKKATATGKRRPKFYYQARSRYLTQFYGTGGWVLANLLWTKGRAISWLREKLMGKQPHTCEYEARDLWQR